MRKRVVRDERQAELFQLPDYEPPPAPVKAARQAKRQLQEPADNPAPEATAEEIVARLTPLELDDLVRALPDDRLAHIVISATRDLKRRLARGGAQRRSRSTKGGASDLERAICQIATEFREGAPSDEW